MLNIINQKKDIYKLATGIFDILYLELKAKAPMQGHIPISIEFDDGEYQVNLALPTDAEPDDIFTVIAVRSNHNSTHIASYVISAQRKGDKKHRYVLDNIVNSLYDTFMHRADDLGEWARICVYSMIGVGIGYYFDDQFTIGTLSIISAGICFKIFIDLALIFKSISFLKKQIKRQVLGFIEYYREKEALTGQTLD